MPNVSEMVGKNSGSRLRERWNAPSATFSLVMFQEKRS
jgi:hypothetical protein